MPVRPQPAWPNWLLAAGAAAMAIALMLVLAGVPAKLFYDIDGEGRVNKNTSHDPLAMSRSIDLNMKYIKKNAGYDEGQYNGLLSSINKSEDAVPALAQADVAMSASLEKIDTGLTEVLATTEAMRVDMDESMKTDIVSPKAGKGIHDKLLPILDKWKQDYGVVGSYPDAYADITAASPVAYHALKGGIVHMTRHLAVYWAADGVRVNCLSPGPFPSGRAEPRMVERLRDVVRARELRIPVARYDLDV